jgi:two-component system nitrogen regulation sensor histidine kinase NtrY
MNKIKFNLRMILLLTVIAAACSFILYFALEQAPSFQLDSSLTSSLTFFALINLNIIVVMVLVFLVVKNIVKLVLDRRKNILGAKLRTRLIAAFVGLSLIPTVLLFLVAKGILESVMQAWFSPQITSTVDGSLNVGRFYYESLESQINRNLDYLSHSLATLHPYLLEGELNPTEQSTEKKLKVLQGHIDNKRKEYGLYHLAIVDDSGRILVASSEIINNQKTIAPEANLAAIFQARQGKTSIRVEQTIDAEFIRGYAPIYVAPVSSVINRTGEDSIFVYAPRDMKRGEPGHYSVMASMIVSPELSGLLSAVLTSYDEFKELSSFKRPIASSYLLILVVVTLLIVFAAIWVGFYLARELSVPIGLLAEGTQQVALGNLDHTISEVGGDEISLLIRSFNQMIKDLKETTGELEERRRYMEAVLANLGVGVISIDPTSVVKTFNSAAREILNLTDATDATGKQLVEFLPAEMSSQIVTLLERLYCSPEKIASDSIAVNIGARVKHLQLTASALVADGENFLGAVLLMDDVTELVSAQRMAAWREVARRIAHEIKNPLTPIQLSAQRMKRRFDVNPVNLASVASDKELVIESAEVIIRQVEILRALVDEFSAFARMPRANPMPGNLNLLIGQVLSIYKDAHSEIDFEIKCDENLPECEFDREQINRALINIIDNAVASIKEYFSLAIDNSTTESVTELLVAMEKSVVGRGIIEVESHYNRELGLVTISISDNGVGVRGEDKGKLFEPYFSKRKGGTGLGLAIVSTIIADHQGFVRVRDNYPHGVKFIIELPLKRSLQKAYA